MDVRITDWGLLPSSYYESFDLRWNRWRGRNRNLCTYTCLRLFDPTGSLSLCHSFVCRSFSFTLEHSYTGTKLFSFDDSWPVFIKFPGYLKRNGYKVPTDPKTGPCVEAHGKQLFDYFRDNPDRGTSFAVFMAGQRHGRVNWLDVYPIEQRMLRDYQHSADAVLLVDIAGGRGHDLKDFRARHVKVPGRLVLEDLPEIVSQIDPAWREGIETVAYDFFTPQPIKGKYLKIHPTLEPLTADSYTSKGAKAYYFRNVLHDWDDVSCCKILKNQISAMKPGYSRILINEMVLNDTNTSMFSACLDVGLMYMLCGMQRSRQQWYDLLDKVGLKIMEIWTLEEGAEALIEADLKGV